MPNDENNKPSILLRRMSSFAIKNEIESDKAVIINLVQPDGSEVDFDSAEFGELDDDPNSIIPIGRGGQGVVYAAKIYFQNEAGELETRFCVLKQMYFSSKRQPFESLLKITQSARSSIENNTLKLISIIEKDGLNYALLPYCDFFLDTAIERLKKLTDHSEEFNVLRVALCLHLLLDLCHALTVFHLDKDYIHGDVKPGNIGYYRGHWCLTDLDTAKKMHEPTKKFSGTYPYTHPESFHNIANIANPSNDLFAMGLTAFELLTQEGPEPISYFDLLEKYDEMFLKALRKKYGEGQIEMSLSEALRANSSLSIYDKLLLVIQHLTQPLASNQPDLLTLKNELEQLRNELLQSYSPTSIKQVLEQFYESMDSKIFSSQDSQNLSPLSYPTSISLLNSPWGSTNEGSTPVLSSRSFITSTLVSPNADKTDDLPTMEQHQRGKPFDM